MGNLMLGTWEVYVQCRVCSMLFSVCVYVWFSVCVCLCVCVSVCLCVCVSVTAVAGAIGPF